MSDLNSPPERRLVVQDGLGQAGSGDHRAGDRWRDARGHPASLRTVVDEALSDYETVCTAAGTVVPPTFDELVSLTRGTVLRVAAD
jgi:hypothetical protein